MSTIERVQKLLVAILRVSPESVAPQSKIAEIVDLDSLHLVEIAAALEEEFHIDVPTDDLTAVMSVQDVARLVERHL